jgi:hypothetical protein
MNISLVTFNLVLLELKIARQASAAYISSNIKDPNFTLAPIFKIIYLVHYVTLAP